MGPLLPPENVSIAIGRDPGTNPAVAALGKQIFSVETPSICRSDIAMVLLDRELPGLPIVPMRLGQGNARGERLRVVGYGLDHNGDFGKRNTLSGLSIAQVGRSSFLEDGDPVPPRTFMTVGPTLCFGDSGGPAFTENEAITAVWSQIVGNCGDEDARNFFTQIAPFEDTIVRPAFEAAGHEPLLEEERPAGSGGAPAAEAGAGGDGVGVGGAGGATDSGGAPGEAGTGGEQLEEPPTYRGPRKEGGLKCEISPDDRQTWHAALAPLLIGLAWSVRRARAKQRGS